MRGRVSQAEEEGYKEETSIVPTKAEILVRGTGALTFMLFVEMQESIVKE